MQRGLSPILIILVLAGIIALASGAYYLGTKKSETFQERVDKQNPVAPFTSSQTPQPTSSTDDTVNWKTYTFNNKIQSLQFKYPSEWKKYTDSGGVGYDDTGNGYYSLNIGFLSNVNNLPLEEFVNNISSYTKTAVKVPVYVGSKKGIQINNQQNGVYYSTIYCQYDDQTILEIDASGNRNTNQELLTKILSTFKLTN